MLESIIIPFFTIAAAEFLDKSQLSVLLLASKTKHHLQLLIGVMLAFALVDGSAILAGAWLTHLVPATVLKILSGIAFVLFGVSSLRAATEDAEDQKKVKNALVAGFSLTFLSEWGDKTQLASAVFATHYPPLHVFIGVILALFVLTVLAIFLSKILLQKFQRQTIAKVAGAIFIILGVLFLLK